MTTAFLAPCGYAPGRDVDPMLAGPERPCERLDVCERKVTGWRKLPCTHPEADGARQRQAHKEAPQQLLARANAEPRLHETVRSRLGITEHTAQEGLKPWPGQCCHDAGQEPRILGTLHGRRGILDTRGRFLQAPDPAMLHVRIPRIGTQSVCIKILLRCSRRAVMARPGPVRPARPRRPLLISNC